MEVPAEHKKPLKEFTKTGPVYREFLLHLNQKTIIDNQGELEKKLLNIDAKLNMIGEAMGLVKKKEPKTKILTPHIIGKV